MEEFLFDEIPTEQNKEIEEMLFNMSSDDFVENEIKTQITDDIFESNKRNYVDLYIEKFKYLKQEYNNDDELLNNLKDNKETFITNIVETISDQFDISIDDDAISTKMAKTLYNFFVVNYSDNLKSFFYNFIQKNKKLIIAELKKQKTKVRDSSTIAAKAKYYNSNDAMLINNINIILFNIIPSFNLETEFINYITDFDDDTTNTNLTNMINDSKIVLDTQSFDSFLTPFTDKYDGYSDVISKIVIELNADIKQNEINILE